MGASQSQQSQPAHTTTSPPSPTHTAAHQTVDNTADKAHTTIDTVASTTEQTKQKLREAEEAAKRKAEEVKQRIQETAQQAELKGDEFKQEARQRAEAIKDTLKQKVEEKAEEARQRVEQSKQRLAVKAQQEEQKVESVWERIKRNVTQRYDAQYHCPPMEELLAAYHTQLRFTPLPLHRLVVNSPNMLDDSGWWQDLNPLLQLSVVSTAERADTLLGQFSYSGAKGGVLGGLGLQGSDWFKELRGEAVLAVPTAEWRTGQLRTDNTWVTDSCVWRSRNAARLALGEYSSVSHVQSPVAAFTFRWDYRKQFHSITSGLSSTLYHDPATSASVTAAVSATSEPFNDSTLPAHKPMPELLSAIVHYVQPQCMADVQAAYEPATGQLHSYAARALFRSSSVGTYPHCKVGVMLSDRAVLAVQEPTGLDVAPLVEAASGGGGMASGQPVLSTSVVYSPSGLVDWKCHVASSGQLGVMMQRRLAPTLGVEVSVLGNVVTKERAAVGVGVTLG